jgi:hypothetical protein
MLYDFKCRATASVVMTQKVGETMLAIIGKEPGPAGIITVEQMPAAIRALELAVKAEGEQPAPPDEDDEEDPRKPRKVSLAQRAWPLQRMLEEALAAEREITWGV